MDDRERRGRKKKKAFTFILQDVSHLFSGQFELTLADLLKHHTFKNMPTFSPLK